MIASRNDGMTHSKLIQQYAKLYEQFEIPQDGIQLPRGDQKAGVIGKYYVHEYIKNKYGVQPQYEKSGADAEISFRFNKKEFKIQVKAVSYHSKTSIISPINLQAEWDEVYFLSLDNNFYPDGCWVNSMKWLKQHSEEPKLSSQKMPDPTTLKNSKYSNNRIYFSDNRINEFIYYLTHTK